jgi:hypothetical protein
VVLYAKNGNVNLGNTSTTETSVLAGGTINQDSAARFGGYTLLANGTGDITFNGASKNYCVGDNVRVISQGKITYNGSLETQGTFISKGDFTSNGNRNIHGNIITKQNVIFNGAGELTYIYVEDKTTPPNLAPTNVTLTNNTIAENNLPNAVVGNLVGNVNTADPDIGDSFEYQLVSGTGSTDNSLFQIVDNKKLIIKPTTNFEAKSAYSIRVRTTDQGGLSVDKQLTVSVLDVNEIPTALNLSGTKTVAENGAANAVIGTFTSTDQDAGENHQYSLVAGAGSGDNAKFTIDNVTKQLKLTNPADFESQSGYSIRVKTTDKGGLTYETAMAINVADVNEAPTNILLSNDTVVENAGANKLVGTFASIDPDFNDTHKYSFVAGTGSTDNAKFTISNNQLILKASADFETQPTYSIRVQTKDQNGATTGLTYEKVLTIKVGGVFENLAPTAVTLNNQTIAENNAPGAVVGNLSTVDPNDLLQTGNYTYTLVGGTGSDNNSLFSIQNNKLIINPSTDFETKTSYKVRVRSTDGGGLFKEQALTVNVTNVNENPNNLGLSNTTLAENIGPNAVVATLSSSDLDGAADAALHSYSLVSGSTSNDNAKFSIVGKQLILNTAADFETKSSYTIRAEAKDVGGLAFQKDFTINITDVNEAPTNVIASSTNVNENGIANQTIAILTSTDPDANDTHKYSLVAGTGSDDNGKFTIVGNELKLTTPADYEAKSSYSIRLQTRDKNGTGLTYQKQVTINVNNVNEKPINISLNNNQINENAGANALVGLLSSDDIDGIADANTHVYALAAGTGDTDNAKFTISGKKLILKDSADYETKSSYNIRVSATDVGGLGESKQLVINVKDLPEINQNPTEPKFNGGVTTVSIPENGPTNQVVATLSSTDPNPGDVLTYTLGTGGDNTKFTIVDGNKLVLVNPADYETQSQYTISVTTTDGKGGSSSPQQLTIQVIDDTSSADSAAPTAITLDNQTIAENNLAGAVVGNLGAIDINPNDTFTYVLAPHSSADDNDRFSIQNNKLIINHSADYETKNLYTVVLRATDASGLYKDQALTVNVTNVNENPNSLALSNNSIAENVGPDAVVATFSSTDLDGATDADLHNYFLLDDGTANDNYLFNVVDDRLVLKTAANFETKSSYSIRAEAKDQGGLTYQKDFTININNVNENPINISLNNNEVMENAGANAFVGNLLSDDIDGSVDASTHTYALETGAGDSDNAKFEIVGKQLVLKDSADYETKSSYNIRVAATDAGGLKGSNQLVIQVKDDTSPADNVAPTGVTINGGTVVSTPENGTPNQVIATLSTTDPNVTDTHTYTLPTGVSDNAKFTIVDGNQLVLINPADYETKSTYTVTVTTTDNNGGTTTQQLTINITDDTSPADNVAPTGVKVNGTDSVSIPENGIHNQVVATLSTTDPNITDTHTYSLPTGVNDNAKFTIVNGNQLVLINPADYETKSRYIVSVMTTDNNGASAIKEVFVDVEDVIDTNANQGQAPTGVVLSTYIIPLNHPVDKTNGTTIATLSGVDPTLGDTFTFTLVPTADDDSDLFKVVNNELKFLGEPTASAFYEISIKVTDSTDLSYIQPVKISVGDGKDQSIQ